MKTPRQALNPAFLKQKPERKEIELFKQEFISLLDRINDAESEEFHKNLITDFLNSVYYKNNHYINTKGYADLVIHNGKDTKSPVGVLIEVKKPTNTLEMISKDNLNAKAFQELVLYYFRERSKSKNFELRYLIITNINEWFVFDAQDFEKLFYQNKTLLKNFNQFEDKKLSGTNTDFFYKEIAAPEIEKVKSEISYTYFDIRSYEKTIRNEDKEDDKKLIALYKFLSPTHLLKLSFAEDYNQLNKEFYAELLHILGLEEIKDKSQKFIVRKSKGKRDNGSIIESAINELDSKDKIYRLSNARQYGNTYDEQQQKRRKSHKRRAAIEPIIGHLKQDHRLSRNFYKGDFGDAINVMLAAAAFNFKRVMNKYKQKIAHIYLKIQAILFCNFIPKEGF